MTTVASKLAVDGGPKTREKPWPQWPTWDEHEERALLEVLRSGQWWSIGGTRVPEFEAAFARFQDAKHAVCVTNGTAALEVTLQALDVGSGDEVIVPPYTFVATASSVLAVSATPIFADIERDSLNLNPAAIEPLITPRTRAIIPVHVAGRPADMDGILAVARHHGLRVIEDAAQAHAAEWRGHKVGAIGDAGTFSFQASKNLNAGEGGAIVTDDDEIAEAVWSVHNVGRTKGGGWYEHNTLGGNFRMTEWQAAILLAQLERLPRQTARRTVSAARLTRLLAGIPGIATLPDDPRITRHAYHLYVFKCNSAGFGGRSRTEFLRALNAEGVPSSAGYVPLYREALFKGKQIASDHSQGRGRMDYAAFADLCPECEQVCGEAVWLGQNMLLGDAEDIDDIAGAVIKIQRAWA